MRMENRQSPDHPRPGGLGQECGHTKCYGSASGRLADMAKKEVTALDLHFT